MILSVFNLICVIFSLSFFVILSLFFVNHFFLYQKWKWFSRVNKIPLITLGTSLLVLILSTLLVLCWHNTHLTDVYLLPLGRAIPLTIDDLSLMFFLLIAFLFPVVIYLAAAEFSLALSKFFILLSLLYFVIFLFMFCCDIIFFYILYEFMIMLVFFVMYLSANTRGGIEATMLFLGWAVLGSIFVGMAVIYIVYIAGATTFSDIKHFTFSLNETYLLAILLFAGFGTKLSIWPFWYWLPRAHVEVSTATSIFLSCILIKICLYGFIRLLLLLNSDISLIPLIFFVILCTFDVTYRLSQQVDLKAVIAYSSVLHVNLLMILTLINPSAYSLGFVLYVWGHSYSTAGLFFAVHLIERCFGTRSTFEISGLYNANPLVGLISIFAIIACFEFPLNFYFWGEVWLWISLFSFAPVTASILLLWASVLYVVIFFRIWWGVLFGASSYCAALPITSLTISDIFLAFYIIGSQYIVGIQPHILGIFIHK